MKKIIFISKDAVNKKSLPVYGNTFWKTPNIDALAQKGTVFHRYYTAGGSTAMAFTAMALGRYCYETSRKDYRSETSLNGDTIFDKLYQEGYDCHILWDDTYAPFAAKHFLCEGEHTVIHNLPAIKQGNSVHVKGQFDHIDWDEEETEKAVTVIRNEFQSILDHAEKDLFVWIHLPHVLRGRQGYGSDIDVFDRIIGIARELFGDESIYISADHGHMNGAKNQYHYGFDVGEGVINIPLITPRLNGLATIDFPVSSIQMYDILKRNEVKPLDHVISETAYYAQPNRTLAVVKKNYKYIYKKKTKEEFLYDLSCDPEENRNLVYPEYFDRDRNVWYSTAQCFYYPYWKEAESALSELREIKDSLWKTGTFFEEKYNSFLDFLRSVNAKRRLKFSKGNICNTGK